MELVLFTNRDLTNLIMELNCSWEDFSKHLNDFRNIEWIINLDDSEFIFDYHDIISKEVCLVDEKTTVVFSLIDDIALSGYFKLLKECEEIKYFNVKVYYDDEQILFTNNIDSPVLENEL